MNSVEQAAEEWWESKRPVDYEETDHLKYPTINCVDQVEERLATAVADQVKTRSIS